jgi:nitronate monooxygenase
MWYQTKASEILGIQYPILQGPFAGNLSSVELVSTVSNAGGLGGYGAYTLSPQEIIDVDEQMLKHTKASELMQSILEETTTYFDHLKS